VNDRHERHSGKGLFGDTRDSSLRQLKRTLIEGAVVLLPIATIVLLVLGIIHHLRDAAEPLVGRVVHPVIAAILFLVVLVLIVGAFVRSAMGRWIQRRLERLLFERIPGYKLAKAVATDQIFVGGAAQSIRPALATIEEGQCPALVMDEFADGRLVVFVPGSPAPMAGALYIFTPDKVEILDVPLLSFVHTISAWGLGMRELLEPALAAKSSVTPATALPPAGD
jgi:uncharacterized membrane protein